MFPNEGARLLAEAMSRQDLTQRDVEARVGAGAAMAVHWLSNPQRRPSTRYRVGLFEQFGIPIVAWDHPPSEVPDDTGPIARPSTHPEAPTGTDASGRKA